MKLNNNQVVGFVNGLSRLQEKRLPIKIGFAITKNLKALDSIIGAYEAERKKILDKYAKKDDKGEYVTDNDLFVFDNKEAYTKEMTELLSIECEVEIHKVTFDDLERCDLEQFDSLSVLDLSVLEIMTE